MSIWSSLITPAVSMPYPPSDEFRSTVTDRHTATATFPVTRYARSERMGAV
jgi:hypothetical protein